MVTYSRNHNLASYTKPYNYVHKASQLELGKKYDVTDVGYAVGMTSSKVKKTSKCQRKPWMFFFTLALKQQND